MPEWVGVIAVIGMALIGVIVLIQLVAMTVLLVILKNLVMEIRERLDPLVNKTHGILTSASEIAESVQEKAERVGEATAKTSEVVGASVQKTTGLLQEVVTAPIIGGAAFTAGVRRMAVTWRLLRAKRRKRGGIPAEKCE